MSKPLKSRTWALVVYPDSAPEDWRDKLRKQGVPAAISPLHDRDVRADGTAKKPHWHVLLCWAGPTTPKVVASVAEALGAPTSPELVRQVRGYYRYLVHADDPDKAQYDALDVQHLCGFNPSDYTELTRSELDAKLDQIEDYIAASDIIEYWQLMLRLREEGQQELRHIARRHTIHIAKLIESRRHHEQAQKAAALAAGVDPETGEVIERPEA